MKTAYNGVYDRENLNNIGFPLGGIGAGMYYFTGTGGIGSISVRNAPNLNHSPNVFSALTVKGENPVSRILEGAVPKSKIMQGGYRFDGYGNGHSGKNYGLPHFKSSTFSSRFPFADVKLEDSSVKLDVSIKAWSPFIPNDSYNSSLPAASLEYTFKNSTSETIDAIYYFCSFNFMRVNNDAYVSDEPNGFILGQNDVENEPWQKGEFYAFTSEDCKVNAKFFRGVWFDTLTMLWNEILRGEITEGTHEDGGQSAGGYLAIPFTLKSGESKTISLNTCWYVKESNLRQGPNLEAEATDDDCCCGGNCCGSEPGDESRTYKPWYTSKFKDIRAVADYYRKNSTRLKEESAKFSDCFYDSTLPPEILEAVSANLSIIKSPTVLRQADGRLWCWEGCFDDGGCCHGSCTHVWNYAQAIPHLFPELERSLRYSEFFDSQDKKGHQTFRTSLPIRKTDHEFHAASDGQLGGIMKLYREWRISGNTEWLRTMWYKAKESLEYCINVWDKKREGVLREPHHNTYDIEFWGADGMCSSFYLGALKAASMIADELGEDGSEYYDLYQKGRKYLEEKLYNGEYFIQEAEWETLEAKFDLSREMPEVRALCEKEGPKYQYKNGCISDGVLGAWIAEVCGIGEILDDEKVKSHLYSIYKYNYKEDLSEHSNPQRPGYAFGDDGGLLLCSWPHGDKPALPFVYSDEVWTGIEYQVASHLIMKGYVEEGLKIVRTCRDRYDGYRRNPYDEYECGHWYARAMSSYGLLQAFTGVRYDGLTKKLYVNPPVKGDFKSFLCTVAGYGSVGIKDGVPFLDTISGKIDIDEIVMN